MWDHLLYFGLGFGAASIVYSIFIFYWLKRKWQTLLMGLGAKMFSKGLGKIMGGKEEIPKSSFREVGRQ